jgi:predicted NAD/FAD-dependent oxidoreductase
MASIDCFKKKISDPNTANIFMTYGIGFPFNSGTGISCERLVFPLLFKSFSYITLLPGVPTREGMVTGNFLDEAKTSEVFENLLQVRFFPSFSLGLFYNKPTVLNLGWKWKYFPDSPLVRFVAVDSLKRGDPSAPTSVCVQSQRSWARENIEMSKEEALPLLLGEVNRLLPGLPRPDSHHSHKWRFSQIRTPYPG